MNPTKQIISHNEVVGALAGPLSQKILEDVDSEKPIKVYGVPRGGVFAAYALLAHADFMIVTSVLNADVIVDDIIDSGATRDRYAKVYPDLPFYALLDKQANPSTGWIVFPWEVRDGELESVEDNITRLLQHVGEDPERGGLLETPKRVAKAWSEWTSGYTKDPKEVLKVFEDGGEDYDEMVVVRNIPFYSHCEHHMAPFFGTATIGYIPDGKIVGLSKLSRILDIYARRLQVQERLTNQVVDILMQELDALGAGCIIQARHMCMESRGVCQQGHDTVTSALRGVMKDQLDTRNEFMSLAK